MFRALALLSGLTCALAAQSPLRDVSPEAWAVHQRLLTLDTHCDTPGRLAGDYDMGQRHDRAKPGSGCLDFPRMKEGGLDASFFAVFVGQGPRNTAGHARSMTSALRQFDDLDRMFQRHSTLCAKALTAADAARIQTTGKRAIYIGLENGDPIGQDVSNVDLFYRRGARYITLAHTRDNDLCDSSTDEQDPEDRGLSAFGARVVARMNDLGMMIDVSHISDRSFFEVLRLSRAPVLASHSCARAIRNHPRNLSDAQLLALKKNGGVIQLCILSDYIKASPRNPERQAAQRALAQKARALGGWESIKDPKVLAELSAEWEALERRWPQDLATVKDAVDHIDHIVKAIGIDHVGIGTDFDGGGGLRDCSDVTELPRITQELLRRGYREGDLAKIWGGNALRVMAAAEQAARH